MAKLSGGYPPTEFSQKYSPVLAPKGKLVAPNEVFGENGVFDKDVEEKTRTAFKVTIKKLEKLNSQVTDQSLKEDLEKEKFDQVGKKSHSKSVKKTLNFFLQCDKDC